MRVLLVPEVYRPSDATAAGTLRDAVSWVDQWLERVRGFTSTGCYRPGRSRTTTGRTCRPIAIE
jgi:hypothetical protein